MSTTHTAEEVRGRSRILSAKDHAGTIRSFFPYWDAQIRPFLLHVVKAFPADRLDFKPKPMMFTARECMVHIAEAEFGWVGEIMAGEPWGSFVVPVDDNDLSKGFKLTVEAPDVDSILALLEKCHRPTQQWLERPIADLDTVIRYRNPGGPERVNSAQWILSRVQEHEIHHRMQLVMYLRLLDIEPPPTM